MILREHSPMHLMYGLNVHPGETWAEVLAGIRGPAVRVRERVAPGRPFALGLRLGHVAARELARDGALNMFRSFLLEQGLYVPSINGFPMGRFHGAGVKEQVYAPDWTTEERQEYTLLLMDLLSALLPEGISGSISTVPVSFRPCLQAPGARQAARARLLEVVRRLVQRREATGQVIHLGLEPEPACLLETVEETIAFFQELFQAAAPAGLKEADVRRHLGVCLDTCHMAVGFEAPAAALKAFREEGLLLSRVQLSAAPVVRGWEPAEELLAPFDEPAYLHQVGARFPDGTIRKWTDLPEARAAWRGAEEIRAHFHVPLYWTGPGALGSTADLLGAEFFRLLQDGCTEQVEIETYTFDVLPDPLRRGDLVDSLCSEYQWVLERLS